MLDSLEVPAGVITGCAQHPAAFTDPALDPDIDAFRTSPPKIKAEIAAAKRAAERRAAGICKQCPILKECGKWAETADVFGVVAGTFQRDRDPNGPDEIDLYSPAPTPVSAPKTPAQIAQEEARRHANRWSRLTPVTAAIYDALATYGTSEKTALIEQMATLVPQDKALAAIGDRRAFASDEERYAAGARRYAQNILRIQTRRRTVDETVESDGEHVIRLNPIIAAAWRHWRHEAELADRAAQEKAAALIAAYEAATADYFHRFHDTDTYQTA